MLELFIIASLLRYYLVDVRLGYYKSYNDLYIRYNLYITFKEFEKLTTTYIHLLKVVDEVEDKLEDTKKEVIRLIVEAYKIVTKARIKAYRKYKELRFIESKEDSSY
jgi:hypothetical protein